MDLCYSTLYVLRKNFSRPTDNITFYDLGIMIFPIKVKSLPTNDL